MALVLPPGYGTMTFVFDVIGDPEEQTTSIAYAAAGEATSGQLQERMIAFAGAWGSLLSNQYTLDRLVDRYNDGGVVTEQEFVGGGVGTSINEHLPSNCAGLVSKRSAQVGRQHQGRMYIPGVLSEGEVDVTGRISDAQLALMQTAASDSYTDWLAAPTGITELVILHSLGTPLANTPTIVGGLVVERYIATQRRRMRS